MRILIVADTHVPDFAAKLPVAILEEAARANLVLHAGDVTSGRVLDELASLAPVLCALGNNDGRDVEDRGARERIETDVDGVAVAMVHVAGPSKGRPARLRRWFPQARVVIFGHSHIPMAFEDERVLFLNPGSPTWKRRQPTPSFLRLHIRRRRLEPELVTF
jgi:putative phosphoesterase